MFRPVATVGSVRTCGAVIVFSPVTDVFCNGLPVAVVGSIGSHGDIATATSINVFANMLPVVRIGDIAPICPNVNPPHYSQPVVTGQMDILSL